MQIILRFQFYFALIFVQFESNFKVKSHYFSERELYDLKEFDDGVSVYSLEPHTSYTAMVVAMLAPGITRQFTIPNIMAGKEINMAAYQASFFVLSPAVVMSLLVIIIVAIIIIAVSIIVFLMSQTW